MHIFPLWPRETFSLAMSLTLSRDSLCGPGSFSHQASVFTQWTFFLFSGSHSLVHTHIDTHSFCFPSSWLPPWVNVVFGVRQELQSLRPPQCVPGRAAANLRQLFWPNHLKHLWKTTLAAASPASSSEPTEKQDIGKTTLWSSGDSRWMRAIKHLCLSFWESSSVENFSLFPPRSPAFPLGALLPRVTSGGLWFAAAWKPGGVGWGEFPCVLQRIWVCESEAACMLL